MEKTVQVRILGSQAKAVDEIIEANPIVGSRESLVRRWVAMGLQTEGPVMLTAGKKLQEELKAARMTGRH